MKKFLPILFSLILLVVSASVFAQTAPKKKRPCPVCAKHSAPKDKCAECTKTGKQCLRCMHIEGCPKCRVKWLMTKECAYLLTREGKAANRPKLAGAPNIGGGPKPGKKK